MQHKKLKLQERDYYFICRKCTSPGERRKGEKRLFEVVKTGPKLTTKQKPRLATLRCKNCGYLITRTRQKLERFKQEEKVLLMVKT